MKKVIISVNNGMAEVIRDDGLNVSIIDLDLEEDEQQDLTGNEDVVIEIWRGTAEIVRCANGVDVEIIDNDITG